MRLAPLLVAALAFLAACSAASTAETATPDPLASTYLGPPSGMDTIMRSELPPEAYETLALIDEGGPFPYRQDGAVFQNREGLLPDETDGYYHEYTVETPGSDDRGARRIVTGAEGQRYWTADHYDSFAWIVP
jgi:ribonuclease T1